MIKVIFKKGSQIKEPLKKDDAQSEEMAKNISAALAVAFMILGAIALFAYLNDILKPFVEKPYEGKPLMETSRSTKNER